MFYSKFCANKYGEPIDDFKIEKDSPDANDMNCCKYYKSKYYIIMIPFLFINYNGFQYLKVCARTKQLIPDIECCQNGNFKKVCV